jgi:hypothetical protein
MISGFRQNEYGKNQLFKILADSAKSEKEIIPIHLNTKLFLLKLIIKTKNN